VGIETEGGGVDCSGSVPPFVGDWLVTNPTFCQLSSIILSVGSNLFVRNQETLELEDSTVELDGRVSIEGRVKLSGNSGFRFSDGGGVSETGGGPQVLAYDNSGSLTSGFGFIYEYDDANRLKTVRKAGALVESYIYDHEGRRFKKVSGGETTYYIGKDYQTTVNSSGTHNTIYYYANGELVGRKDSSGTYYYHNDHLGGTHVVTDQNGNEVLGERTRYLPFGDIITGGAGEIGWTGHRWDQETGQVYMINRYYNPTLRRFTQADPVIPNVYDPQSLNRYTYVNNNPVKYVDPSGNEPNQEQAINPDDVINFVKEYEKNNPGASAAEILMEIGKAQGTLKKNQGYIHTEKYGWIDTWHFFTGATGSKKIGYRSTMLIGELIEKAQAGIPIQTHSGWSYEDMPSDKAGAVFGGTVNNQEKLSLQLQNFLAESGATNANEAPNYNALPVGDPYHSSNSPIKYFLLPSVQNQDPDNIVYVTSSQTSNKRYVSFIQKIYDYLMG